ncbi:hypothetical protein JDV02_003107 [Purpureocillium takamizusanense]|uniref:Uncharacterized protein n=1 Tax=Purpureocillium takamizusanense TaxID=2060973 RepID=A0A9Q8QCB3_9HYPO|nr:uncharacterized protein JDV02_003107 [Purpureocillium takamizusanense]UNI16693.1 hypothetical protein JDV02_003107 [Purpureocillium takamizusanense]
MTSSQPVLNQVVRYLEGPDGFEGWLVTVELALMASDLQDHTARTPDPATKDWVIDDIKTRGVIIHYISHDLIVKLKQDDWTPNSTAKATMERLKTILMHVAEDSRQDTIKQSFNIYLRKFGTIEQFIDKIHWCWTRLEAVLDKLDEKLFCIRSNGRLPGSRG